MAAAVIPVIVLVFVVTIAVAITLIALSVLVVTATRTNHGIRTDRVGNIIFLELTGRAILAPRMMVPPISRRPTFSAPTVR